MGSKWLVITILGLVAPVTSTEDDFSMVDMAIVGFHVKFEGCMPIPVWFVSTYHVS